MHEDFEPEKEFAYSLDAEDPLADLRSKFYLPEDTLYMDGNSLGPLSKPAKESIERVISEWEQLGIEGWTDADPPWFWYGEYLGEKLAPLIGANPDEVVVGNSTTVNIHTLIGTFLDAIDGNTILVNNLDFPTDHYAIRSQLRIRGLDPNNHLRIIESQDGYTINESKIIEVMETEDIDILFFPSVLYQSGQRFRMQKLTEEAHKRNICVGFDIAHSIGVMPHSFGEWDVDFAVWCNYKYINGGPGAIAALYVNDKHFDKVPSLTGWWGHEKSTQFDMNLTYTPADSAGAWQIGTIPILSAAPIEGALDIFDETDIETVRDKSVQVTSYLEYLITERIDDPSLEIVTPKPREHRGGHIAITHPDAYRISQALRDKDVIVDFRDPDIIRICPAPLYTQYQDVWSVVAELNDILRTETYQDYDKEKDGVT